MGHVGLHKGRGNVWAKEGDVSEVGEVGVMCEVGDGVTLVKWASACGGRSG